MVNFNQHQYQFYVWEGANRTGDALHLSFETIEEAQAAWQTHRSEGRYRSGIFIEWRKSDGEWWLKDHF